MKGLFSPDGPVIEFLTVVMDLILLNVLTMICCLPIVTGGAAMAALHYVLMQIRENRGESRTGTYFAQFKSNLKNTIPAWLLFFAGAALIAGYYLLFIYTRQVEMWMFLPVIIVGMVMAGLFAWIFPLMARFENPFSVTVRNAALLAVGYAPRTLGMIAVSAGVLLLFTRIFLFYAFFFLMGFSLSAYLSTYFYLPVVNGLIRQAKGEDTEEENDDTDPDSWELPEENGAEETEDADIPGE